MSCGTVLSRDAPAPHGARKVVSVVFCDVAGSTPFGELLDPEPLRAIMARFFGAMRAVVERHGGTVEKYIGDAVVAVFGIPLLHEDDAVRAVGAALGMHEALASLNEELRTGPGVSIEVRIGVNTGEVVVGDPAAGQALVVGDAVNVAARLEQAAQPGEILIGRSTFALVRTAFNLEPVEPLVLKGKRDPVIAFRALPGVPPGTSSPEPPLVDRGEQLALLGTMFGSTARARRFRLVTILGTAGVGKSRLSHEFVERVADDAVVLEGRCLPYGDGITFWPVAEIVRQACGITNNDTRRRGRSRIDAMLAGAEDARVVADRVAEVTGFGEGKAAIEESFWAIRRFLEWTAREQPAVVVWDDLHWAEPTLLDLVQYLAGWSRDAPVLMVCLARPDLLDVRSGWATAVEDGEVLTLEPLTPGESRDLVLGLLGTPPETLLAVERVVEAAEGNPLFVEEIVRMLQDDGVLVRDGDRWAVRADLRDISIPATIHSLLSARLDRLDRDERTLIRTASVIGREFWWGAVAQLVPEPMRSRVTGALHTLVRKQLIRPARSALPGHDAFRFHHQLILEAAYEGAPKEMRADVHERFAAWLERTTGERVVEYEEVVGYHLERAHRYRVELGSTTSHDADVASWAATRLGSAGRRALGRGDVSAASDLLGRAVAIAPEGYERLGALLVDRAEAQMELGELSEADRSLDDAITIARASQDRGLEAHAAILRLLMQQSTDPKDRSEEALRELEGVIPVFEALGDDLGLARASRLMADVHWTRGRYAAADEALRRAIEHARYAGATWEETESLGLYAGSGVYGRVPIAEIERRCSEVIDAAAGSRLVEAGALRGLSVVRAMEGRFDEAREFASSSRSILEDLGLRLRAAFVSEASAFVERQAGDPAAAERALRAGLDVASEVGEQGFLATATALLAHELIAQGRLDEAESLIDVSEEATAEDDLTTQVLWRAARGRVLAERGRSDEAEGIARQAVKLAEETDDINMRADVLMDLSRVLDIAGRPAEVGEAIRHAIDLYRAKGNTVSTHAAERRLAELSRRR